ncbi:MAG: hypothetical protein P9M00_02805 [Candidatus Tritonobacter lacicola]|nr:hypothetical protein [Candidatus Tritonobacter lacicola]
MARQLTLEAFKQWGAEGGRKSRRTLQADQARIMALHSAAVRRAGNRPQPVSLPASQKHPHGTQEWAAHNVNIQLGCEHDCLYCYAKCMAIRFKRSTPTTWSEPRIIDNKVSSRRGLKRGKIMFPTTHDITPTNIDQCSIVLEKMLQAGNQVLVVMKPHLACVKQLCERLEPFRQQLLFRFTIGSVHDNVLSYWEPHAPSFEERMASLEHTFFAAFSTSVSAEPMLDNDIDALVSAVRPYVTDSIWLGRVNQLLAAIANNRPHDNNARQNAQVLLAAQHDGWILALYERHRSDAKVKWKDSIKKVVGLERPTFKGLDT